jgi:hypothetical protein
MFNLPQDDAVVEASQQVVGKIQELTGVLLAPSLRQGTEVSQMITGGSIDGCSEMQFGHTTIFTSKM